MYWLPRDDGTGNFPVWSEYVLDRTVLLGIKVHVMWFVFIFSGSYVGMSSASDTGAWVDSRFFFSCSM